ncbi:MAG: putative bifunctional diguanylate cyclase/phosphodiesterase [Gaiellales bacterium]
MLSPNRLQALFELSRALIGARDERHLGELFATQAPNLCSGRLTLWTWERDRERLVSRGTQIVTERVLSQFPDRRRALEQRMPVRTGAAFLVPLAGSSGVLGLIEVEDAAAGDLASGGLGYWQSLASVVAAAVEAVGRLAEVRRAEARFRSLVEQMPAVTYVDAAGTGDPIYASPQLEKLFGVPAHEWLDGGAGWTRRIHAEDRKIAAESYDEAVASGEPYQHEYRLVDSEGNIRWVRDEAVTTTDTERGAVVQGVIYDITDRKLAEQRYLDAQARFRTLVERLPLAIYVDALDEQGTSIYNSPQNTEITGYTHEEWVADPDLFARCIHPDDRERVLDGFEAARLSGQPFAADYRIVRPDGSEVWVHDESVVVRNEDGEPLYRQGYLLDISGLKEAERRLSHLAYHDSLTNLPNRAMFHEHLEVALARAERAGQGVAVLYVDLDDFKLVNDSFGHGAGDELLCEVARRLRHATRNTDVVARQGGDEFLILVADLDVGSDSEELDIGEVARMVAEQLRDSLSAPFQIADTEIYCSGSIGISMYPVDAADAESLLKHADIAMYRAKESGRDAAQVYVRSSGDSMARLSMAGRLRRAIEREQFVLYYQPLVELRSGAIVGVEALIRWRDGDRGLILPNQFIPLAERTGMISDISEWVIAEACRQGAVWRVEGLDLYVSVNLPPVFWQPTAMRQVLATIESFGLSPDRMMVELTESAMMTHHHHDEPIIAELHERGLKLAIDDFGTGHSSLGRLHQMAVTTLKIDRSFVKDLPTDKSAAVLVSTMIRLADGLGLQALAEGIETPAQRRWLIDQGCPLGQGFLFSRPVPAERIPVLCWMPPRAA